MSLADRESARRKPSWTPTSAWSASTESDSTGPGSTACDHARRGCIVSQSSTKAYQAHPISLLFPAMSGEEYEFLLDDIRNQGLKHPITLLDGKILDGWHRYRACREAGVEPRFVRLPGGSDALAEVISQNLARRQLSPAQRYGVFLRIADQFPQVQAAIEEIRRQSRQRQAVGQPSPQQRQRSSDAIGRLCGVSHATVERVDRLRRLSPEAFEDVVGGRTPLLHALNRASAAARREKLQALEKQDGVETQVRLLCGDFRQVLLREAVPAVTLCWADPPWDRASLPLWEGVGEMAARLLRPGGVLLAYPSQVELPEIIAILGRHLRFHWVCAAVHSHLLPLLQLKLMTMWQPILVYTKGPFDPPVNVLDVIQPSKEKDQHPWQRPAEEFLYYTRTLTRPGEWVVDFTAGSFASGKAAKALGRNYVGVDIALQAVEKGRLWLDEEGD